MQTPIKHEPFFQARILGYNIVMKTPFPLIAFIVIVVAVWTWVK